MVTPYFKRTTPASRLALLAALALLSSCALGGCTSGGAAPETAPEVPATFEPAPVSEFVPEAAALQKTIECPSSPDDLPTNSDKTYPAEPRGSVPEDFAVEKVFICRSGSAEVDGVTRMVVQQQELQGDFAPLLKALAVPSDRADGGQLICNAILEYMPIVWLVNTGGEAVDAALPTTACRQASGKPETQKAIDGLKVIDSKIIPGSAK